MSDKKQIKQALSAEDILNTKDREIRAVFIPDWDMDVNYIPPSLGQKSNARKMASMPTGKDGALEVDYELLQATISIECAVKPDGSRMFNASHVEQLKGKNANALKTLANAILGNA